MNDATALRAHLFATIQAVRDKTLEPDAAQAISNVAKQIIDIDKTAIQYMDKIGGVVALGLVEDLTQKKKVVESLPGQKPALGYAR